MEGAPSRKANGETAFAHRTTPFVLAIHTRWQNAGDDEKCMAWASDIHRATQEYAQGVYVNFLSIEGENRVKEAYTPKVWKRLVSIKNEWDPKNVFRMNQNIKPSA
jgi:FAD/FMN-containing dehydrogenase